MSTSSGTTKAACALPRAALGVAFANLRAVGGEALGRVGAGALGIGGDPVELIGDAVERRDIFGVGRRPWLRRLLQDRADAAGERLDQRELLVLILRHETLQRRRAARLAAAFARRSAAALASLSDGMHDVDRIDADAADRCRDRAASKSNSVVRLRRWIGSKSKVRK